MEVGLIEQLIRNNFSFFTGVPCSLLSDFFEQIAELENQISYVAALREEVAVGLAAGATLAGKKSVVLMQNSGLGASVNALASLVLPFEMPILFVISVRGYYPDKDTAENEIMGRMTMDILEKLGIDFKLIEHGLASEDVNWASNLIDQGKSATLLIV